MANMAHLWLIPAILAFSILVIILFGALKTIWRKELIIPLKPIGQDTRDAYIVLGVIAGLSLVAIVLMTNALEVEKIEGGGVVLTRRALTQKVQGVEEFLANFYALHKWESFGKAEWKHLFKHIREDIYEVTLHLKQEPVPDSLFVSRGSLVVMPQDISVKGTTLTFRTNNIEYSLVGNDAFPAPFLVRYLPKAVIENIQRPIH